MQVIKLYDGRTEPIARRQIVVDFDDTLYIGDWLPNTELIARLELLREQGFRLVLFSARGMKRSGSMATEQVLAEVEEEIMAWLIKHKLFSLFDELRLGAKPIAGAYIDDKAIYVSHLQLGSIKQILAFYASDKCKQALLEYIDDATS